MQSTYALEPLVLTAKNTVPLVQLCHYVQHEQQQGRLEALVSGLVGASQDAQQALLQISSSVESVGTLRGGISILCLLCFS
jgi:hypothetical protein